MFRQWLAALPLPMYAPADEGAGGSSSTGNDGGASPASQTNLGGGEPGGGQPSQGASSGSDPDTSTDTGGSRGGSQGGDDEEPSRASRDAKTQPATLSEAIKASLKKPGDKAPTSEPANDGDKPTKPKDVEDPKTKPPGDGDGKVKDPKADEGKDGKPPATDLHKHPDFQRVTRERDSFKADADEHRAMKGFMDEKGLSNEDLADALALFDMLHNDPQGAHAELTALLQAMDTRLGNVLSPELQKQVEDGELTEAGALAISRAEATARNAQGKQAKADKALSDAEVTKQHQEKVTAITKAADSWEADRRKHDPDFAKKRGKVGVYVRAILHARGKLFQSEEDAVAVLGQAYDQVNKDIAEYSGQDKGRRGNLDTGSSQRVTEPAGPPASLREAIDRSVGYTKHA